MEITAQPNMGLASRAAAYQGAKPGKPDPKDQANRDWRQLIKAGNDELQIIKRRHVRLLYQFI